MLFRSAGSILGRVPILVTVLVDHLQRDEAPCDLVVALALHFFDTARQIFGLDGIGGQLHESAAVALESCAVCAIPFARLTEQRPVLHTMNAHLLQLLSREIVTDQHLLILLGKRTAEERIAAMLVSLSSRFRRRRLSPTRFRLPMSRADLGSYLGLVIETVSRVLTRLQRQGLVRINQREIEILDLPRLHDVAGIAPPLNDA